MAIVLLLALILSVRRVARTLARHCASVAPGMRQEAKAGKSRPASNRISPITAARRAK